MLALWFVLGAVCGAFFSTIVMALLFVAKESDENVSTKTVYRTEDPAVLDSPRAA